MSRGGKKPGTRGAAGHKARGWGLPAHRTPPHSHGAHPSAPRHWPRRATPCGFCLPARRLLTRLCFFQSQRIAWSGVFTESMDSLAISSKCSPHSLHPKKVRMYLLMTCSTACGSPSKPAEGTCQTVSTTTTRLGVKASPGTRSAEPPTQDKGHACVSAQTQEGNRAGPDARRCCALASLPEDGPACVWLQDTLQDAPVPGERATESRCHGPSEGRAAPPAQASAVWALDLMTQRARALPGRLPPVCHFSCFTSNPPRLVPGQRQPLALNL